MAQQEPFRIGSYYTMKQDDYNIDGDPALGVRSYPYLNMPGMNPLFSQDRQFSGSLNQLNTNGNFTPLGNPTVVDCQDEKRADTRAHVQPTAPLSTLVPTGEVDSFGQSRLD